MAEAIAFPDVEDALQQYLTTELAARGDTATAHVRVPHPRPARFATVARVGGPRRSLIVDDATVAVECWATTPGQAHDLIQLVRALIHAAQATTLDSGVQVYRVQEFAGPAHLPDPVSDQARYTMTFSVQTRGTAI